MRKKSLILMSLTLCLTILFSACNSRPIDNKVKEDTATTTAPEVKEEPKKEEPKMETQKEEPKTETPKEEPKEEEVKKETPKTVEKKKTVTSTTTKTSEQPKQTVAPQVNIPKPQLQEPVIKSEIQKLLDVSLPNNGKFKIAFERLEGPVPVGLFYYITNINYEKEKGISIANCVALNGKYVGSSNNQSYGFMFDSNGVPLN